MAQGGPVFRVRPFAFPVWAGGRFWIFLFRDLLFAVSSYPVLGGDFAWASVAAGFARFRDGPRLMGELEPRRGLRAWSPRWKKNVARIPLFLGAVLKSTPLTIRPYLPARLGPPGPSFAFNCDGLSGIDGNMYPQVGEKSWLCFYHQSTGRRARPIFDLDAVINGTGPPGAISALPKTRFRKTTNRPETTPLGTIGWETKKKKKKEKKGGKARRTPAPNVSAPGTRRPGEKNNSADGGAFSHSLF